MRALGLDPKTVKSGWVKRLIGTEITQEQAEQFIACADKQTSQNACAPHRRTQVNHVRYDQTTKSVAVTNVVATDDFLRTYEWRRVRMQALKKYGARCQCCGTTPAHGAVMNVDHIKPRKIYPELALSLDNLQILCHDCNHGKGNWDMTDWREKEMSVGYGTEKI